MKEQVKRLKKYYFNANVVVNFSSQLSFVFLLFWGRDMTDVTGSYSSADEHSEIEPFLLNLQS